MAQRHSKRGYHPVLTAMSMHGQATTLIAKEHDYSYGKSLPRHRRRIEANLPTALEEQRWVEEDQARLRAERRPV